MLYPKGNKIKIGRGTTRIKDKYLIFEIQLSSLFSSSVQPGKCSNVGTYEAYLLVPTNFHSTNF